MSQAALCKGGIENSKCKGGCTFRARQLRALSTMLCESPGHAIVPWVAQSTPSGTAPYPSRTMHCWWHWCIQCCSPKPWGPCLPSHRGYTSIHQWDCQISAVSMTRFLMVTWQKQNIVDETHLLSWKMRVEWYQGPKNTFSTVDFPESSDPRSKTYTWYLIRKWIGVRYGTCTLTCVAIFVLA